MIPCGLTRDFNSKLRDLNFRSDRTSGKGTAMGTADDKLIAIDVLLQPDLSMIDKSKSINARLRENYQSGYALDATHMPHVTLLQRFVQAKDLDAVTAAITKVLVAE